MIPAQEIGRLIEEGLLKIETDKDFSIGSASLDVRLGNLINSYNLEEYTLGDHIDDEHFQQKEFSKHALKSGESVIVSIHEKFNFPDFVAGILIPRGSITKLGISFPTNFINAGYKGNMSVLLTNHSPMTINLVPGIFVGQVLFFDLKESSKRPYAKGDKYYEERSDKAKLDQDEKLEKIFRETFPSLYKNR